MLPVSLDALRQFKSRAANVCSAANALRLAMRDGKQKSKAAAKCFLAATNEWKDELKAFDAFRSSLADAGIAAAYLEALAARKDLDYTEPTSAVLF